jgi:hypothetical protein
MRSSRPGLRAHCHSLRTASRLLDSLQALSTPSALRRMPSMQTIAAGALDAAAFAVDAITAAKVVADVYAEITPASGLRKGPGFWRDLSLVNLIAMIVSAVA